MESLLNDASPRPASRPRRLRRTAGLRSILAETMLQPKHLIQPLFVRAGIDRERPIPSLPGQSQLPVDRVVQEIDELAPLDVSTVLLFGIPEHKDPLGTGGWDPDGPVPRAIRAIKRHRPGVTVIADVCLCEYTSHGHCGALNAAERDVDNDATLALLARAAVTYAQAGADLVAPSAMMDGQVGVIRAGLDDADCSDVAILSYAAKYASAFYGPFREAAESAPAFGNRSTYQLDSPNVREALREVELDQAEGADVVMVKPAGPYLDVISRVRTATNLPLAAYQVSGEYAMLKAAAERGWIDERRAALETLIGIRRAGADLVITYYAKQAGRWLAEG